MSPPLEGRRPSRSPSPGLRPGLGEWPPRWGWRPCGSASRPHRRRRRGFSLLEVVLALSILVGAIAVLGELVRLGLDNAAAARDLTQAQLLCESKLAEITSGVLDPQSIQGASFPPEIDPDGEWTYSVTLASLDLQGLIAATVTVTENVPAERRPLEFALVRWIRDPGVELPSETAAAAAETEESP